MTPRRANKLIAAKLTQICQDHLKREPVAGDAINPGKRRYTFDGQHWYPEPKPKRPPRPEQRAGLVYGDFELSNRDNFFAFRWPTRSNWYKQIAPALRRLIRRLTGKPAARHFWNVDALTYEQDDQLPTFDALQYTGKYDYQGGEFVELQPPQPRPPKASDP